MLSTLTGAAVSCAIAVGIGSWFLALRDLRLEDLPANRLVLDRGIDFAADGDAGTPPLERVFEQAAMHPDEVSLAVAPEAAASSVGALEDRRGNAGAPPTSRLPPPRPPAPGMLKTIHVALAAPAPTAAARAMVDRELRGEGGSARYGALDLPRLATLLALDTDSASGRATGDLPSAPPAPVRPRLPAFPAKPTHDGEPREDDQKPVLPSRLSLVPVPSVAQPALLHAPEAIGAANGEAAGPAAVVVEDDRLHAAALVETAFTFKDGEASRDQVLHLDGCYAELSVTTYDPVSNGPQQRELSVFEMRRFRLVEAGATHQVVLSADAGATNDLLLWYEALAETGVGDEELLLLKLERGDFGMFPSRNRRETRILSGGGSAPLPVPLAEVALTLPRDAAPAARAALESYMEQYCQS